MLCLTTFDYLFKDTGVLTFANKTDECDYISMAYAQALSLKAVSNLKFAVIVPKGQGCICDNFKSNPFDHVIEIDWDDGFDNEYKAYDLSPFHETIKTDADMLWIRSIDHWLRLLRHKEMVCASHVLDHRGEIADDSMYRPAYKENNLPNLYSALTYFRKSETAQRFFRTLEKVTREWESVRDQFQLMGDLDFSTDVGYSIASVLSGIDVRAFGSYPAFVHMKPRILKTPVTKSWEDCFMWSMNRSPDVTCPYVIEMVIQGYTQYYPIHYYEKEFCSPELIKRLEDICQTSLMF